jgi:large subunit ribosomal protein L21
VKRIIFGVFENIDNHLISVNKGGKFMYAVVSSGGKQYKVQEGEILRLEKISGEVGNPVSFDNVLLFSDGERVSIGQPLLENVRVSGHIVEQGKAKKIVVFKYKRRKRYRRKQGHRQQYTAVKIESINSDTHKQEAPEVSSDVSPEVGSEMSSEVSPEVSSDSSEI